MRVRSDGWLGWGGPQGPTPLSLSLSSASSEQENGQGFGSSLRPRINSAGEKGVEFLPVL